MNNKYIIEQLNNELIIEIIDSIMTRCKDEEYSLKEHEIVIMLKAVCRIRYPNQLTKNIADCKPNKKVLLEVLSYCIEQKWSEGVIIIEHTLAENDMLDEDITARFEL